MPITIKYEQVDNAILWHNLIKGKAITFKATSVRQERTGVHARISIIYEKAILAWSFFNIERSEERGRLANQAFTRLNLTAYSKEDLRYDLDAFCNGLWDYLVSQFTPEMMDGEERLGSPEFLLEPYILADGGTILFSPPGRGKSLTGLGWGVSIDAGIDTIWTVKQCNVMYINLERGGLKYRLAAVNQILGLPLKRPLLTFNARGHSFADIMPAVRKSIQEHNVGFVVLDSISRAGYGELGQTNWAGIANNIIDNLNHLCPAWLALGHTPRGNEEHVFGGIMYEAGADIVIQLRSQSSGSKLGVGYEIVKANEGVTGQQRIYAFEFKDWSLKAIRPAKPSEFPEIESKAKVDMLQSVIDFILAQESGDATATMIANEIGYNRANVSSLLSKRSDKFIKTRKEKNSQYYGVLEATQTLV